MKLKYALLQINKIYQLYFLHELKLEYGIFLLKIFKMIFSNII